ncbi:MAG: MgtC/SapB family protein [Acidobacteria bacterium]|nr:MgtC/SapB family protein [Acidobacteriota bacterium]
MNLFWEELAAGLPDPAQLVRIMTRLIVAAIVGAVVGIQRERAGKSAGLRTHMLVSLGATLFVLAGVEFGMSSSDLSRVIQGIITGIGFIGGGAILKQNEEGHVKGLTTAAGIWMTSTLGVAVGLGRYGAALISAALTWVVLAIIGEIEFRIERARKARGNRERA